MTEWKEPWHDKTLGNMLEDTALRYPNHIALVSREQRITYRELQERVIGIAKGLLALGVRRGDKVGVLMPNCPEWAYCFFGAELIGAVVIPINTRFKSEELKYILKASDATTLIFLDQLLNIDFVNIVYETCPEIKYSQPGKLDSRQMPLLKNVICLSKENHAGMYSLNELIQLGGQVRDEKLREKQRDVLPSDVALILFTSGTTSFPKGAELLHYSLTRKGYYLGREFCTSGNDRIITGMPFFHIAGLCLSLLQSCTYGACSVTMEHFDVEEYLGLIQQEKCTMVCTNDAITSMTIQHKNFKNYDISTLRAGYTAGTGRTVEKAYEQMGIRGIVPGYGLTETCGSAAYGSCYDSLDVRMNFFGKPVPGVEIKIIDPQTGKTLPPGQQGEIMVRGWCLMKDYYKMPRETAETIEKDGWCHTGDLGVLNQAGYLNFTGRLKDMFRCGGENVSPGEVEAYLFTHPKVKQVAVTSVPDQRLGEVCAAFIILRENQTSTEEEIIDFCRGKIAGFKVPRHVRFIADFEYSASGKIQKFRLRENLAKELKLELRDQHATG